MKSTSSETRALSPHLCGQCSLCVCAVPGARASVCILPFLLSSFCGTRFCDALKICSSSQTHNKGGSSGPCPLQHTHSVRCPQRLSLSLFRALHVSVRCVFPFLSRQFTFAQFTRLVNTFTPDRSDQLQCEIQLVVDCNLCPSK